jgi:hypothetical protein
LIRFKRFIGRSLAVLLLVGVIAPVSGNAKMLHSQSSAAQTQTASDKSLFVQIHNKGLMFEDVNVGGQVYTVRSEGWLQIQAPAGTRVYTEKAFYGHRKGDVLFAVTPKVNNSTITIF